MKDFQKYPIYVFNLVNTLGNSKFSTQMDSLRFCLIKNLCPHLKTFDVGAKKVHGFDRILESLELLSGCLRLAYKFIMYWKVLS